VVLDLPEHLFRARFVPLHPFPRGDAGLPAQRLGLGEGLLRRPGTVRVHPQNPQRVQKGRPAAPGSGDHRLHPGQRLTDPLSGEDGGPGEVVGRLGIPRPQFQRPEVLLAGLRELLLRQVDVAEIYAGLQELPVLHEGSFVFPPCEVELPLPLVGDAEIDVLRGGQRVFKDDDPRDAGAAGGQQEGEQERRNATP
jgi:hypothetical protein